MGFGPSVKKSYELAHISASQINSFLTCEGMWAAEKLEGHNDLLDKTYSLMGSAIHTELEYQVKNSLGIDSKKRVKYPLEVEFEAKSFVENFDWEKYFLGHNILNAEVQIEVPLQNVKKAVMQCDVISINEKKGFTITDWKTGYGHNKGVDAQAQINALGIKEIFANTQYDPQEIVFRRIYPRLPGEKRGECLIEEYLFNNEEIEQFRKNVEQVALQMQEIVSGEREAKLTPSDECQYCSKLLSCNVMDQKKRDPKTLVQKLTLHTNAIKRIQGLLKKVADKEEFFVGRKRYGYEISESYRFEKKGENHVDILAEENPQLLAKYAKGKVGINDEIKTFLEEKGYGPFIKNRGRKTFKWLNEEPLKEAAKQKKQKENGSNAKLTKE